MNKLLDEEIAQKVAEKQGHKWALTAFARDAWGKTKRNCAVTVMVIMVTAT